MAQAKLSAADSKRIEAQAVALVQARAGAEVMQLVSCLGGVEIAARAAFERAHWGSDESRSARELVARVERAEDALSALARRVGLVVQWEGREADVAASDPLTVVGD
jgi:hypothetical protein